MGEWNTIIALEQLTLEAVAISELFTMISDYEKEGANKIECYSNAMWFTASCACRNANAMKKTVEHLTDIRGEEARQ